MARGFKFCNFFAFLATFLTTVALGGCTETAADYGRSLFDDPTVSTASSNIFYCSQCHETTAKTTELRPGYTLSDSASRVSYWGGFETTLLDAMNQCVTNFMRGRALDPADEKARGLHVYLESISPDKSAPELPLTVVQNIVDVPSGDPARGKTLYDQGCGNCHGAPHTGAGRLSPFISIVPDDSVTAHGTDPKSGARPVTIEKVRHGKFFSVGGNMPLYSLETLSDEDLGAILGYLETFGLPPSAKR